MNIEQIITSSNTQETHKDATLLERLIFGQAIEKGLINKDELVTWLIQDGNSKRLRRWVEKLLDRNQLTQQQIIDLGVNEFFKH